MPQNLGLFFRYFSARLVLKALVNTLVILVLTACGFTPRVDRALNLVDEAITRLGDQSADWQLILQDTRDKLIKEGFNEAGSQVKQIIDRTAGNTLVVTFCVEDNFRQRLRQELLNIKAQLLGQSPDQKLKPVICKASAKGNPIIDLSDYPNSIELVGYDLGTNLKASLVEQGGTKDITSFYNSGMYEATLTLGANGPSLSDSSQKIILTWKENGEEIKAIGITRTKAKDCAVKEDWPPYTPFRPEKIAFNPPLIKGDADFHGNGPNIHTEVRLVNLGERVIAWVYMNAREVETNGSTADGMLTYTLITPPGGYQVLRVNADIKANFDYKDDSHEPDHPQGKGGDFYQPDKVTFVGDTAQDDICLQMNCGGYHTGFEMEFKPIQFSLIQIENCTVRANNPPSEIDQKYAAMQAQLGKALGPEIYTADRNGRMRHFQNGWIYWTPQTGARVIWGRIYDKWASLGYEAGFLGYPTTDELTTPDGQGRYNHFQGGSIYWSPSTDAHEIHGGIHEKWASLGWEKSSLGYPVSDELFGEQWIGGSGGNWSRVSEFQHGWLVGRWSEGIELVPK
jgi:hypothetical protein